MSWPIVVLILGLAFCALMFWAIKKALKLMEKMG